MTTVVTHRSGPVPCLWPGSTVVVIGGGCSLTREDVEYCRGRARVIAVKEAIQLAPWADAVYAADAKWWRFYRGATEFTGLRFTIEQDPKQEALGDWPNLHVLRNTGVEGLERAPDGVRTGYNSGYQAINLAVHLGATKVVLLGFDLWRSPTGEQNWFGPHPIHRSSPYPLFLQAFGTIADPLRDAGVTVLNATRTTVLTVFPRVSLDEALA